MGTVDPGFAVKRTEILRAVQARRVPRGLGRGWLGAVLRQERLLRVGERLTQPRKDRELFMDRVSAPHELTHDGPWIPAVLTGFDEHSAFYIVCAYSVQRDHLFRGKAIADSCQADHSSKRGRVSVPPFGRKRTYLISNSVYKGRLGGGVGSGTKERAKPRSRSRSHRPNAAASRAVQRDGWVWGGL